MGRKKKSASRQQMINYIVNNVNELDLSDRKLVLKLIVADTGEDKINEGADGSRIVITAISKATLISITDLIVMALDIDSD